jgi:hypothetical protein
MASFRKALAVFGSMLIALSGQSSAKSLDHSAEQPDLNNDGIDSSAAKTDLIPTNFFSQMPLPRYTEYMQMAQHANSGPTGHINQPGHANFDPAQKRLEDRGGSSAVHANSGPTGHINQPGHANFDPAKKRIEGRGDSSAVHANSGPTGHINQPGHANFDPAQKRLEGRGDSSAVHANSGPTGHINQPGHANFDPAQKRIEGRGDSSAVHANSGPTGHINQNGHANFDPAQKRLEGRGGSSAGDFRDPSGHILWNQPGHANSDPAKKRLEGRGDSSAAHANSGPTTHTNQPGHANFSMNLKNGAFKTKALNQRQIKALQKRLEGRGGSSAAHANSGPTTHTNQPGHANFSMNLKDGAFKTKALNQRQIKSLQRRLETGK